MRALCAGSVLEQKEGSVQTHTLKGRRAQLDGFVRGNIKRGEGA